MSARDDDFTQVLTRLTAVRDELRTTTSPERVAVLRELAAGLAADGEKLLGVHLTAPSRAVADPAPAAVEAPPAAPQDTLPVDRSAIAEPPSADDEGKTSVLVRHPGAPETR